MVSNKRKDGAIGVPTKVSRHLTCLDDTCRKEYRRPRKYVLKKTPYTDKKNFNTVIIYKVHLSIKY